MNTVHLADSHLVPATADRPLPGSTDLLIRVRAAGVTPTELQWYPTQHTRTGEPRRMAVPGHEFSGVVEQVGCDVGSLEVGREVFGMNDWFDQGAMAEFCVAPFADVAPKPREVSHTEAASLPIAGLTAWQGLFDHAHLQPGETVLIHGGAGSVGALAVQLAHWHGARVISTASARNLSFVAGLGAERAIDYHAVAFETESPQVDVVFDTVGGETLERSWGLLRPGGRMVTIAASGENADGRVKQAFFIVEPNQKQLTRIADLAAAGVLRPVVDTVVPLERAPDAFLGKVERSGRGKLVVVVGSE